jgi:predicted SAM-dependent methyltransferase
MGQIKFDVVVDGKRTIIPNDMKQTKLDLIASLLKPEFLYKRESGCFDCLDEQLKEQFNIIHTDSISENPYHTPALQLIDRHKNGLVLDFGAGQRSTYYSNVVNLEIVKYDTTDVVGLGECLPFKDNVFDAIHSNAVLEHVKDPFSCAKEMMRVLKPGGELMCCVPFLQPFHAYPHHYYNMTYQGLRNLFSGLNVRTVDVYEELRPITTLQWIINSWSQGLSDHTRNSFLNMKLSDFLVPYDTCKHWPIVTELSAAKNEELACCNTIFATKPLIPVVPLSIDLATYGTKDVTTKIRQMIVDGGYLTISVKQNLHMLFGDPLPNQKKELHIKWTKGTQGQLEYTSGEITCQEYAGYLCTPLIV